MLAPWVSLVSRTQKFDFSTGTLLESEIGFPHGTCTTESVNSALNYSPKKHDVFVVSQMKSGTTWLQQIAIQILNRGKPFVDTNRPLASVSCWLESQKTVSIDDAPLIGEEVKCRVVKTHLPVQLCPLGSKAKYIYIARHPVSCFASCVDFLNGNLGTFGLDIASYRDWFVSKEMWFGTWANHVANWWLKSKNYDNVLFLKFEDLKNDLSKVIDSIATLLGVEDLSESEKAAIVEACSFKHMKQNANAFEMYPPHIFQTQADFFVSGDNRRFCDVPDNIAQEIVNESVSGLKENNVDAFEIYPDLTEEVVGGAAAQTCVPVLSH